MQKCLDFLPAAICSLRGRQRLAQANAIRPPASKPERPRLKGTTGDRDSDSNGPPGWKTCSSSNGTSLDGSASSRSKACCSSASDDTSVLRGAPVPFSKACCFTSKSMGFCAPRFKAQISHTFNTSKPPCLSRHLPWQHAGPLHPAPTPLILNSLNVLDV